MSLQERTLVIKSFDPERTTKELLHELCLQAGPVRNVVLRSDHAFVEYDDAESVGYARALLNGVKLFGHRLHLEPKLRLHTFFEYSKRLQRYIEYDKQQRSLTANQQQHTQQRAWASPQQARPQQMHHRYQQEQTNSSFHQDGQMANQLSHSKSMPQLNLPIDFNQGQNPHLPSVHMFDSVPSSQLDAFQNSVYQMPAPNYYQSFDPNVSAQQQYQQYPHQHQHHQASDLRRSHSMNERRHNTFNRPQQYQNQHHQNRNRNNRNNNRNRGDWNQRRS